MKHRIFQTLIAICYCVCFNWALLIWPGGKAGVISSIILDILVAFPLIMMFIKKTKIDGIKIPLIIEVVALILSIVMMCKAWSLTWLAAIALCISALLQIAYWFADKQYAGKTIGRILKEELQISVLISIVAIVILIYSAIRNNEIANPGVWVVPGILFVNILWQIIDRKKS